MRLIESYRDKEDAPKTKCLNKFRVKINSSQDAGMVFKMMFSMHIYYRPDKHISPQG